MAPGNFHTWKVALRNFEFDTTALAVTEPHGLNRRTMHTYCGPGHFAIPASTKIVAPCQATFYINLFQVKAMAYTYELNLFEQCTRAYKLKDRHSVILAFKDKFEMETTKSDRSARYPAGGNTLLVLFYALTIGDTTFSAIQSGLLLCEHCVQLRDNIACSTVETCLRNFELSYGQAVRDGKAITWEFLPSEFRPVDQSTGKFAVFKNCIYPKNQSSMDCATFPKDAMLNFIAGSLNNSLMAPRIVDGMRSPVMTWSEDSVRMWKVSLANKMLQIQVYPMRSENRSGISLKFVTADGVDYKRPSLSMYTQPLDTDLWLGSLGFFALAVIMIATVSNVVEGASPAKSAGWSVFWLYGAVIDQIQDVPRGQTTTTRLLIARVLSITYLLAYVVTNHYKAALNVNYIAGNELVPLWHRIDQLLNFTVLYVPMGPCTWEIVREYAMVDQDDEVLSWGKLSSACDVGAKRYCEALEDKASCVLGDERDDLVFAGRGYVCSSYVQNMQRIQVKLKPMPADCQKKRINVLRALNRRLKYIPTDQPVGHSYIIATKWR